VPGNLCTKTIEDIQKERCHFIIPDYQRGYRWTNQQVGDLLDDLYEFVNQEKQKHASGNYYCLQPIVIRKNKNDNNVIWEVIDGQQRLTTIYILLSYFNNISPEMFKVLFSIDYKTRKNSKKYLEEISGNANSDAEDEYIDFFYMKEAYLCIKDWFDKFGEAAKGRIATTLFSYVTEQTEVIWYEPDPEIDPVEIFTRINLGKIPLTDAELIKALFLKEGNFTSFNKIDEGNTTNFQIYFDQQTQFEIAGEWDRIEYALQNDSFWYFLTYGDPGYTRIDFIFSILAEQINEKYLGGQYNINKTLHFSFVVFSKYLEKLLKEKKSENEKFTSLDAIKDLWKKIKELFMTFEEWFSVRELYHYIGYLVGTGIPIKKILDETASMSKPEIHKHLISSIRRTIQFDGEIKDLSKDTDYTIIKRILLLFNIETLNQSKQSQTRFEFDRFKKESWDLEHIHSLQSEEIPPKQRIEWLETLRDGLPETATLRGDAMNLLENANAAEIDTFEKDFQDFYKKAVKEFAGINDSDTMDETGTNGLENICLLDSGTNRGYKNSIFPVKRKVIIEKDINGIFIPLCTKNVFLKYYSDDIGNMQIWSKKDRLWYLEKINNKLEDYLREADHE
jgi:hypothetical protein